jgi:chromosome segregation ATPase
LVAEAQQELERLAGDKAQAAAAIAAARKDATTARVNVEDEIGSWRKDTARAQAEAETAREELAAVVSERDRVKTATEGELREMREMREVQAAARMSERAAADAAHAAAVAEINDKVEHLRQMSRGYEDQARAVEARIAEHQAEVEAARESARSANERADRVEGEAAAARAEAAEHAAIARAALEEATRDREALVERAASLDSDGRAIDAMRRQIQEESAMALEGREKVLKGWEERMSAAERAAKNKARWGCTS